MARDVREENNERHKQGYSDGNGDHARTVGATLIDLLELVRARVTLTDKDVAAATVVSEDEVVAWMERRTVPAAEQAARLCELIAAVERLEVSTKPEVIADWLNRSVPMLDGETPLAVIAAGGYERVAGIAEDFIYPTFT
jgi:DNA-binding transcriptional regulator YiaG